MSKTETVVALGDNAEAELKRRVDRRVEIVEELAAIKTRLDEFKKEDKADGFNDKAIVHAVKMRTADPEKVLATLLLEAECKLYRKAAGVATEIDEAEKAVRKHVAEVPEPKPKGKGRRRDDLN
ncbi:MAG: hypothetical protein B7Y80_01665 [Hyphomicrobium sp. 32-62-53]|nr:MAG: hypothetical protein B7Z29_02015 [Hyphomicrobium sp. 12-62-95]OYY01462.1 MAG: hypothetical protein B7Y80_01665 [Hyphomicrobium sp. 32-62-53]